MSVWRVSENINIVGWGPHGGTSVVRLELVVIYPEIRSPVQCRGVHSSEKINKMNSHNEARENYSDPDDCINWCFSSTQVEWLKQFEDGDLGLCWKEDSNFEVKELLLGHGVQKVIDNAFFPLKWLQLAGRWGRANITFFTQNRLLLEWCQHCSGLDQRETDLLLLYWLWFAIVWWFISCTALANIRVLYFLNYIIGKWEQSVNIMDLFYIKISM